ncbi:SusD/RagB family nutrient-binding outer membrane lipoprotein [Cytophagales bacterium RKSG123]|nr:SusD/RagB family nutrient-binding outer membrane lipoprotein [Xanthovirga aplysinae]
MIHKIKSYFLTLLIVGGLISCGDFLDVNEDPNNPQKVTEDLVLTAVLSNFSYEVLGGYPVRVTNTWMNQTFYGAAAPNYGTYDVDENDVNNTWRFYSYTDVMQNCKELEKMATESGNLHYRSIANIILAWNISIITDMFGDAPFSEAFQAVDGVLKPVYDSQEQIYEQIQLLLDQAIVDADAQSLNSPSSNDIVYGGNMGAWKRLAYTLKARYYLRLSNAPGKSEVEQAQLALNALGKGMSSNADAPSVKYFNSPDAENPWYQYARDGKWNTWTRPHADYVALLYDLEDPRMDFQFNANASGVYAGSTSDVGTADETISEIGDFYSAADAPLYWLVYAEVPFIKAEAELLKSGGVTTSVIEAYVEGIEASMDMYGISDIDEYLQMNVLDNDPEKAYEQLMTQKYIANYLQLENYHDFRRTGYPQLNVTPSSIMNEIPVRFPYPSTELLYNAENVAKTGIPNGIKALGVPVWWDGN